MRSGMRPGRILGALAVLLAVAVWPSGAAAANPNLARIVSPTEGRLVTGGSVKIVVRTGGGAKSFKATLDRADITRSFRRSGSTRVATVSRGRVLRAGMNHLLLQTTDGRGNTDLDAVSFVVGRAAEALLSVRPPRALTSSSPVGLALSARGTSFAARLNGHRVNG